MRKLYTDPPQGEKDLKKLKQAQNNVKSEIQSLEREKEKIDASLEALKKNKDALERERGISELKRKEEKNKSDKCLEEAKSKAIQANDNLRELDLGIISGRKDLAKVNEDLKKFTTELENKHLELSSVHECVLSEEEKLKSLTKSCKSENDKANSNLQKNQSKHDLIQESIKNVHLIEKKEGENLGVLKKELEEVAVLIREEKDKMQKAIHERALIKSDEDQIKQSITAKKEELAGEGAKLENIKLQYLSRKREIDNIENRKREIEGHYKKFGMNVKV